jgi:hypothetical protein
VYGDLRRRTLRGMTQGEAGGGSTGYDRRFQAFVRELRALHITHGKPTLREIEGHAPGDRALSASAVSEVLTASDCRAWTS